MRVVERENLLLRQRVAELEDELGIPRTILFSVPAEVEHDAE